MRSIRKNKKGIAEALRGMLVAAILIVVIGLLLVFSSDVVEDVRDDQTANTQAYNTSEDTLNSMNVFSEKQTTVANVIIAGVIITILLAAFGVFLTRRLGG